MNLERLYFLREEQDLKQKDMSQIVNVSRVAISQWETNKEIIPLNKLNIYSNYFKVSFDYIVGLTNSKERKSNITILNSQVIGNRLKTFRKHFKLSQEDLAIFLNTTHSTISAYESGKTTILTIFAYQICNKYKISMDWLCGKSETMNI